MVDPHEDITHVVKEGCRESPASWPLTLVEVSQAFALKTYTHGGTLFTQMANRLTPGLDGGDILFIARLPATVPMGLSVDPQLWMRRRFLCWPKDASYDLIGEIRSRAGYPHGGNLRCKPQGNHANGNGADGNDELVEAGATGTWVAEKCFRSAQAAFCVTGLESVTLFRAVPVFARPVPVLCLVMFSNACNGPRMHAMSLSLWAEDL